MMMENLYFRWNLFVCISHTRCTSHNVSPVTGAVFLSEVNIPAQIGRASCRERV